MTTKHAACTHPATKAARAACRRNGTAPTTPADKAAKAAHKVMASPKRETMPDPSLPHAFDEDMERPDRCYVCHRTLTASIHSEGPRDLSRRFF
jgi:hypothetical protein